MKKNEMLKLAKQAGWPDWEIVGMKDELQAFAKLVAKHEREACALIGDGYHDEEANCGDLIRARGEA